MLTSREVSLFSSDMDSTNDVQTVDKTSLKHQARTPDNCETTGHFLCSSESLPTCLLNSIYLLLKYPCYKIFITIELIL